MRRLLSLVSWVVRWAARTPRRVIGVLAVPLLIGIALAAGPVRDRPPTGSDVLAGGATAAPPAATRTGPRQTGLPTPTGRVTPVPTLPSFALTDAQRATAVGYVTAANTHDARPGADTAFGDSYTRTRPYVTDEVFALVTAENRRGDYEWSQWLTGRATVAVRIRAAGVPDGAPAPTARTAYARVEFEQVVTPTVGAGGVTRSDGAINLLLTRAADGRWLVSRLLADT